jgi:hypothetical protein
MANLAKQGRNLAFLSPNLAVTSPVNIHKTLGLYVKARLARLQGPMPTHMCAHAHTRRSTSFAYRNGLEITSPYLANLARWFSALCKRPTCLPNNARRCPQSRNESDLAADFELATQRDTYAPVASPTEPHPMGPPPTLTAPLGCRISSNRTQSLFFAGISISLVLNGVLHVNVDLTNRNVDARSNSSLRKQPPRQ